VVAYPLFCIFVYLIIYITILNKWEISAKGRRIPIKGRKKVSKIKSRVILRNLQD